MDGTKRKDVYRGLEVEIVLKKDQPSGKLTRGIVQDLLTSKGDHPRGIKVRLESGQVGRVHNIYVDGVKHESPPYKSQSREVYSSITQSNADDEDFDNFI